MAITLNVPGVALLFETDFVTDPVFSIGCECNGGKGYSGRLSNVPIGAADELVRQGSNMLRRRPLNGQHKEKPSTEI